MNIIDKMKTDYNRHAAKMPSGVTRPDDPVVFVSGECTWTLGMVLSMWAYLFERSSSEICERRIAF